MSKGFFTFLIILSLAVPFVMLSSLFLFICFSVLLYFDVYVSQTLYNVLFYIFAISMFLFLALYVTFNYKPKLRNRIEKDSFNGED
jgi:hypothetical protein